MSKPQLSPKNQKIEQRLRRHAEKQPPLNPLPPSVVSPPKAQAAPRPIFQTLRLIECNVKRLAFPKTQLTAQNSDAYVEGRAEVVALVREAQSALPTVAQDQDLAKRISLVLVKLAQWTAVANPFKVTASNPVNDDDRADNAPTFSRIWIKATGPKNPDCLRKLADEAEAVAMIPPPASDEFCTARWFGQNTDVTSDLLRGAVRDGKALRTKPDPAGGKHPLYSVNDAAKLWPDRMKNAVKKNAI